MPREKSIKLSPKHGVNPSITCCTICGKEIGLALFGRIKGDKEAPKYVYDGICDDCKKHLDNNFVALLEANGENKERTGRYTFVNKRIINQENPSPIYLITPEDFNHLVQEYNKLHKENETDKT